MDGDIPFLPEEIITNILKRLPVKSLTQFQCVSKYWKNLIKNPSFIADHLHHSTHQNPPLLFARNAIGRGSHLELYLLDCEMQVREFHNGPLIDSLGHVTIIGSSNGLLCVEIYDNEYGTSPHPLFLWNPAIREIRQVPRTINNFEGDYWLGFGFSPIASDYKIVRTYTNSADTVNGAEVYSLSTGSWKEIEFGNLEGVRPSFQTVSIDGTIFSYGSKLGVEQEGEDEIGVMVSFDIALEVFTLIPLPDSHCILTSRLTVHENKLAILTHSWINFEYSFIDLWVMEEGIGASEERWSWRKKYTSSPSPCQLHVGTVWRNEIVCNGYRRPRRISKTEHEVENDEPRDSLFLFNLTTNEVKTFANRRCGLHCRVFNYVESLVPVENILIEEH